MRHATRSFQHGLSLVESVVTMGVVAGALQLALPALDDMLQATALSSASQDLLMDLHLARAEALKRNRRVAMCKSADGVQCTAAGGWEQGWLVFHDENNNGTLDPGEERIARREALASALRLRGNQPVANYISYTPLGATRFTGGGFQAGTLTLCRSSPAPTPARQVILNAVGRPRVDKGTVASCEG
jgi:type IV fimbrial biogenesis protein FimT